MTAPNNPLDTLGTALEHYTTAQDTIRQAAQDLAKTGSNTTVASQTFGGSGTNAVSSQP